MNAPPDARDARAPEPDFLIIGAMKCATSTLHEQLAAQPGFFMSDPKEPNFFSDDDQHARGLDWYRGLFAGAPPQALRGESSTHYTKLPTHPRTIERLRAGLGAETCARLRFVYLMRHPVDRLVSHYVHEWSQGVLRGDVDRAVGEHAPLVDYGRYAMQLRPWLENFGAERVLPLFFDALRAHPERELARTCRFLGWEGTPRWHEDRARQNVSSERMRRSPLRDAVVEFPPLRWARRRLVPRAWRDRVKRLWMMPERPALSPATRAAVEARFDEDLAELGSWLGMDLRCADFVEATCDAEPRWVAPPGRSQQVVPSDLPGGAR